jgi:flagellar biosynthesis/type III secretory pathway protein FliH
MRLSDAFEHPVEKPEIELTCRLYNINRGYNKDLLEKCSVLKEYMIFVDYVRQFRSEDKGAELADTITKAIDRCIEENVLKQFLTEHRSEVTKIMELDYTFDRRLELQREEAREEGLQAGRKEGLQEGRKEGLQ